MEQNPNGALFYYGTVLRCGTVNTRTVRIYPKLDIKLGKSSLKGYSYGRLK